MLRIERLTESAFFKMEDEWNGLLSESSSDCFFLSWQWLSNWWRSFGGRKELWVLTLHDSKGLCGIAPLFRERKRYFKHFPVSRVGFLGADMVHSDYLDIITRPGLEEAAASQVVKYLHDSQFAWDLLELTDIKEDSLSLRWFKSNVSKGQSDTVVKNGEICPYLPLPSNKDEYWSALSKNTRYNINRRTKNFFKHFSDERVSLVESDSQEDPETMRKILSRLFTLHRMRWTSLGKQTVFSLSQVENFHMRLLADLMKKGMVAIYSLNVDNEAVAVIYGFMYKKKYYFYQSGFDPNLARYSPGLVLMNFSIEKAIRNGLTEYDFLRGEEAYKSKFTGTFRRTCTVQVWRSAFKKTYMVGAGRLYSNLSKIKKKLS